MLSLLSGLDRDCQRVTRRSFLQIGSLASLGVSLPLALSARRSQAAEGPAAAANCILIWTRGGTSHHDTYDPKPDAPVAVRGEFGVIDTALPGIKFTEICPNMAREAGRFALLRGWNPLNERSYYDYADTKTGGRPQKVVCCADPTAVHLARARALKEQAEAYGVLALQDTRQLGRFVQSIAPQGGAPVAAFVAALLDAAQPEEEDEDDPEEFESDEAEAAARSALRDNQARAALAKPSEVWMNLCESAAGEARRSRWAYTPGELAKLIELCTDGQLKVEA